MKSHYSGCDLGDKCTCQAIDEIDWEEYERRVSELEEEGLTRSDAQSIVDIEMGA
jgi:hypothetical protein